MVSYGRRSRRTRTSNRRGSTVRRSSSKKRTRASSSRSTAAGRRVRPRRAPRAATIGTRKRVGSRKGPRSSAKGAKDLAVFHNPFSKATQQARIPDGKATASLGTRVQNVISLTPLENPTQFFGQGETLHVLLYPGLGGGTIIGATDSANHPIREFYVQGFSDHGMLQQNLNGQAGSWPDDNTSGDGNDIQLKQTNAFAKWRLVSQGLNIKLVNNNESNDGWFEAVRINQMKDPSDYQVTTINDSTNNMLATVAPSKEFINNLINDTNLVQEPSYQTGLLKDIHKHIFQNHPLTNECKFKELEEEYRLRLNVDNEQLDAGTDVSALGLAPSGQATRYYDLADGSARASKLINGFVDQDHDIVYIRLHGRLRGQGGDSVDGVPTQCLFHLCANHEIMYDSSRDLSKFMMPGMSVAGMDAQYKAKKDSTAAADVQMGTSALS